MGDAGSHTEGIGRDGCSGQSSVRVLNRGFLLCDPLLSRLNSLKYCPWQLYHFIFKNLEFVAGISAFRFKTIIFGFCFLQNFSINILIET